MECIYRVTDIPKTISVTWNVLTLGTKNRIWFSTSTSVHQCLLTVLALIVVCSIYFKGNTCGPKRHPSLSVHASVKGAVFFVRIIRTLFTSRLHIIYLLYLIFSQYIYFSQLLYTSVAVWHRGLWHCGGLEIYRPVWSLWSICIDEHTQLDWSLLWRLHDWVVTFPKYVARFPLCLFQASPSFPDSCV